MSVKWWTWNKPLTAPALKWPFGFPQTWNSTYLQVKRLKIYRNVSISCELVGAYLLYLIKEEFRDTCDFGLYRDDGLGVSKATPRQTDLIKKKLCTIFSKNGLRITIEVNKPTVNFLDVTLDLKNGTHRPFSKPGNIPLYVNSKSNHPPRIIQNIPKSINQRLSEIPSDKESFEQAAPLYQNALHISGYNHTLSFSSQSARPSSSRKNRPRNVI